MSNDSRKISNLSITTALSANDRVVVLAGVDTTPNAKTITLHNLGTSLATNSIPIANSSQLGVIKIGDGLAVAANGVVTTALPVASKEATGVVRIGDGIEVDNDGVISVGNITTATYSVTEVTTQTYFVTGTDTVIFADPYAIGSDILIVLPSSAAVEGREILVKNLNGDGYKVRVTTLDGYNLGSAHLEDPVTHHFVQTYDLIATGEGETWIHNGQLWRHTATQRSAPIFYTENDTYHQVVIQNASDGQDASGDFVVYNDYGDYLAGTGPFIDMGINSSNYSNGIYSIGHQNDAYLFNDTNGAPGGNLVIGTAVDASIVLHTNGTTAENKVVTINSTAVSSFVNVNPQINSVSLGNTTHVWNKVYSNVVYTSTINSNNFTWSFGKTGNLTSPGDIVPNANNVYTLGNSTNRWEAVYVGGNSVIFADQNPAYPDQLLTVGNGVFYITNSGNTSIQSTAGLRVGNFIIQNNTIALTDTDATFYIGATLATGNLVINRPIVMNSPTTNSQVFNISREGRVQITAPTIGANDVGAFSIVGSSDGARQGVTNPGSMLHISGNDGVPTRLTMDGFGVNTYPVIASRSARGTAGSPTNSQANDTLIRISAIGWTGGNNFTASYTVAPTAIEAQALENYSNTGVGSQWNFYSAALGSTTKTLAASINTNGLKLQSTNSSITFYDNSVQNTAFNATSAVTRVNVGTGLTQSANVGIVGIDSTAVLSVAGATNQISVANVGGNYTLTLPQSIGTTSDVQFRNLTVANLTVTGTTTSAACTSIHDKIFNLAYDSTSSSQLDGGGFTLGNTSSAYFVSVTYNLGNNSWNTANTNLITKNISAANVTAVGASFTDFLHVGAGFMGYDYPNSDVQIDCNINSYNQVVQQNHNGGTQASSDYVAVNDTGNDSNNYIDFGINSSTYANNAYSMGGPNDGYLYVNGGDLDLATQTSEKSIKFFTGNTTSDALRATINTTGLAIVGNISASYFTGNVIGNANTASYIGALPAANVVSNAQLQSNLTNYQTLAGLAANVATLGYQTSAGLSANVAKLTANLATYIVANSGIISNSTGVFVNTAYITSLISDDDSAFQTTAGLAASVAALTANNTSYVGTIAAANVVSNATLQANLANYVTSTALSSNLANYQTTAGLSTSVAALTSNSANYIGTLPAANVVSNATLQANLANYVTSTTLTNNLANYALLAGASFTNNVSVANTLTIGKISANGLTGSPGQLLASNGSGTYWTTFVSSINTAAQYTFSNTVTFSNTISISTMTANGVPGTNGQVLVANSADGVYWSDLKTHKAKKVKHKDGSYDPEIDATILQDTMTFVDGPWVVMSSNTQNQTININHQFTPRHLGAQTAITFDFSSDDVVIYNQGGSASSISMQNYTAGRRVVVFVQSTGTKAITHGLPANQSSFATTTIAAVNGVTKLEYYCTNTSIAGVFVST